MVSPHSQIYELAVTRNATSVSCSTAGGGVLASENSSGIVAFELLQRTPVQPQSVSCVESSAYLLSTTTAEIVTTAFTDIPAM